MVTGYFQISRSGERNHPAFAADRAVKMITHAVPFQHPRLMRVGFVGQLHKVCAMPLSLISQILGADKYVKGLGLPARAKIKHRPHEPAFGNGGAFCLRLD